MKYFLTFLTSLTDLPYRPSFKDLPYRPTLQTYLTDFPYRPILQTSLTNLHSRSPLPGLYDQRALVELLVAEPPAGVQQVVRRLLYGVDLVWSLLEQSDLPYYMGNLSQSPLHHMIITFLCSPSSSWRSWEDHSPWSWWCPPLCMWGQRGKCRGKECREGHTCTLMSIWWSECLTETCGERPSCSCVSRHWRRGSGAWRLYQTTGTFTYSWTGYILRNVPFYWSSSTCPSVGTRRS